MHCYLSVTQTKQSSVVCPLTYSWEEYKQKGERKREAKRLCITEWQQNYKDIKYTYWLCKPDFVKHLHKGTLKCCNNLFKNAKIYSYRNRAKDRMHKKGVRETQIGQLTFKWIITLWHKFIIRAYVENVHQHLCHCKQSQHTYSLP